ncbi:MAG: hypothetical protein HYX69_16095 [Planctomycetia bacterium]|nr:hypothetical protein [Planctomycetia bacterium]
MTGSVVSSRTFCAVAALLAVAIVGCPAPAWADDVTLENVLAAWRKRESEVHSYRFTCTVWRTYAKGQIGVMTGLPSPDVPPHDVTLRSTITYARKADKLYYELDGESWDEGANALGANAYACGFNEQGSRTLFGKGPTKFPYGEEWHDEEPVTTLTVSIDTMAISLVYRPFDLLRRLLVEVDEGSVRVQPPADGDRIATLVFPRGAEWTARIKVDAAAACAPTAFSLERLGRLQSEHVITYSKDGDPPLAPTGWSWKNLDDNRRFTEGGRVEVQQSSVNGDIPDGLFSITFPVGSWINEHVGKEVRTYLLTDAGKRYLSREEMDITRYDDLMAGKTIADAPVDGVSRGGRTWLIVLNVACVVVLIALVWRKRTRS